MRRSLLPIVAAVLFLGVLRLAQPADAQGTERPGRMDGPDCVTITGQSLYRTGYSHIVHVHNQCSGTAHCEVWTSVDPEPKHPMVVPAGETREQVIRLGSPSYSFQARARCTVEGQQGGGGSEPTSR